MLPPGFLPDLLSRVDIVEVVGRHVELKKAGINHKGLCPFHGEKTPSFIVSPSRQTYHCFGCGAHGDAIRFLTEHGGLHFMDAVRELAQQVGLAVPENEASPEDRARAAEQRAKQTTLSELLARAGEHWRRQLKASPRAVAYLKGRGLTGEIAARFGLGYAPEGWRGLAGVFPRYDDPLLAEAGLVIVQENEVEGEAAEQRRYDRFRDRIMFPIRSVRGEVIGFGGRVLDQGEPKYLNSPETPIFVKGRELYGLFEARQALRERGHALVVEGYMDVVALAQHGIGNAVATLGTACTADHVAKLFRFTDAVVFSFDGDAAGRRAAARALEAALPHATDTRSIRFLFLPPEHDPDSYVRELGADAFERALAEAVPLSAQLLAQAAADCDLATPEGRSRMLSQARPMLALMPEGLLREQLLIALAERGGLSSQALAAHWSDARPAAGRPGERDGAAGGGRRSPSPARAGRRMPPQTATRLDRAAWQVARRSELWLHLAEAERDLLAAQPAPYGIFFSAAERLLHEHGALSMAPLLDELQSSPDGESLSTLLARLRGFHEIADDDEAAARAEIEAVLRSLRLDAVNDELNLIAESGDLSPEAVARSRALYVQLGELKSAAAASARASP